ncbi:hypothetical protein R2F61_07075 [Mollicutes bacterium LVI A0078]|nr:hypothetical protein RZE84_07080 [Mollicutes bacterium LVI A0075]WOO90486.1 hypothetical protein R2F61_07075 [Mollicutes bacterium LVI A0078]
MNNLDVIKFNTDGIKNTVVNMSHTIMTSTGSVESVLEDTQKNLLAWAPAIFSIGLIILFLLMAVGPERVKQGSRDNIFWVIASMVGLSCVPGLIQAFLG